MILPYGFRVVGRLSIRATGLIIETEDGNMIDGSLVTIVLVVIGMGITIMGFQWRQNVAMEKRLREDSQELERRLRGDSQELEKRLREDSQGLESRLREDNRTLETRLQEDSQGLESRLRENIRTLEMRLQEDNQASESRLRGDIQTLERRLETTDADVKTLIGEVGLIKGALLGVSDEVTRSLSERESALTP